jgi:hypothetical protein
VLPITGAHECTTLCAAVLLLKAMAAWRAQHGAPPATAAERRECQSLLDSWQRKVNGIPTIEENFQVRLSEVLGRQCLQVSVALFDALYSMSTFC